MSQGIWSAIADCRPIDPATAAIRALPQTPAPTQAQRDAAAAGVDAEAQKAAEQKQQDWDKQNLQVLGCIRLHLTASIQTKTASMTTACNLWTDLKKDYATPGTSLIFSEF